MAVKKSFLIYFNVCLYYTGAPYPLLKAASTIAINNGMWVTGGSHFEMMAYYTLRLYGTDAQLDATILELDKFGGKVQREKPVGDVGCKELKRANWIKTLTELDKAVSRARNGEWGEMEFIDD